MGKVLVTGGAGFIGSHVSKALLERGDSVVCVDNLNDYYNPNQKLKNIEPLKKNPKYVFYNSDIENIQELEKIFEKEKPERICHLAARAGVRPSIENPHIYASTNVQGTVNIFELANKYKAENVVCASSSSVYGNTDKIPFKEEHQTDFPISSYAATKKAGELLAYTYHHLYNLNITKLRFFTVYGPAGRPDMAPFLFTKWVDEGNELKQFGDGKTKRDYTYIDDIVAGVVAAIDKPLGYEVINLGNGNPVQLSHFIQTIENLLGKKANIKIYPKQPGDVDVTYADVTKAKKLLGYNPTTNVEQGLQEFIKWYKSDNYVKEQPNKKTSLA